VQAKREALRALFAGIPAVMQGGKPPIEAMEALASSTGPLSDPAKEQGRQMFLERLRLAASANQAGLLTGLMPAVQPASGRYRLRESVVIPGQEYLISGTCVENSQEGQDRCLIAKGHNEPTFLISTKSDAQVHHDLEKRALLMIFGGAALFQSRNRYASSLGAQNVAVALDLMKTAGIPVVAQETGGPQGRKVLFNTDDGVAWSQRI